MGGRKTPKRAERGQESSQKELEAARAEARQAWDHLNTIPTPIMAIDKDFTITFMNPAGAGVAGKTPEQVIGTKCYDLFKTTHCQTSECRCGQAMARGEVATGETVVDPQGLNIPIQYTGAPIRDEKGAVVGALEYVIDITATKKAMDEAFQKVEFLNSIPTPVVAVDKEFGIQYINPAGAGAVGRSVEACLAQKCFSLFNTPHCNTADCQLGKAMRENGVFTADTIAGLPSGKLPIRYTGAPLKDADGNLVGALEFVLDITSEMDSLKGVLELVDAAVKGDLGTRADVDKFEGNFQKIVQGVNDALDAVVGPVNEATAVLEKMAANDLTARVLGDYRGDHAKIKDALNTALDNLTELVTQIGGAVQGLTIAKEQLAQSSDQASQASQQVATTTSQLAQGTSQQAASAQEVNQAVEQLSQAIEQVAKGSQAQSQAVEGVSGLANKVAQAADQTAESSQGAAEGARRAAEAAQNGAGMVQNTIDGMARIKSTVEAASEEISRSGERSAEIGKIVSVIQDIAAQTNLLALNAAIEAARAGEQGRGFAVVADEVRQLAERVAKATKEIADLIGGVQETVQRSVKAMEEGATEVDAGTKVAAEAGGALQQILAAVDNVNGQIEQIAAASQELKASGTEMAEEVGSIRNVVEQNTAATEQMQASAGQVSQSVAAIAGVAEENSSATEEVSASAEEMNAQVEEVTAATHSLGEMAESLQSQVAQFRLNGAHSGNGNGKQAPGRTVEQTVEAGS